MLQKIDKDSTLPNSFCETTITLMPKPKRLQKSKLEDNIFDEYRCQNSLLITREMQIKATKRFHIIPVRMIFIKKTTND